MPVVGMVISEISAKKNEEVVGEIEVANDTKLTTVEETDVPTISKKGVTVGFKFSTNYFERSSKKKLAEILIGGNVLYVTDEHAKLNEHWKKTNKLPEDVNIEILNALLRRCIIKAIVLSEDLQMPPPMMLPHAKKRGAADNTYTM